MHGANNGVLGLFWQLEDFLSSSHILNREVVGCAEGGGESALKIKDCKHQCQRILGRWGGRGRVMALAPWKGLQRNPIPSASTVMSAFTLIPIPV